MSINVESDRPIARVWLCCPFRRCASRLGSQFRPQDRPGAFSSEGDRTSARFCFGNSTPDPGTCYPSFVSSVSGSSCDPLDRGQLTIGRRIPQTAVPRFELSPISSRPETNSAVYNGPVLGSGCSGWSFCRGARGPDVVVLISVVLIPLIIIPWRPWTLISAHPLFATTHGRCQTSEKSRLLGQCNDGTQRDRRASDDGLSPGTGQHCLDYGRPSLVSPFLFTSLETYFGF